MDSTDIDTLEHSHGDGRKLGPYTIIDPLGAGGMGVVYRARDERLGRDVAVKVIRPGLLASEAARKRFRKEALALARLNHPNIAAVYDVGVQDGSDYLVMELVRGETLRERLGAGPLPPAQALALAGEIASALEEAHEQGIVHRDLKPGNIMVTPKGHAKILDFGLAKLLGPVVAEDVTQPSGETAGIVGTPLYMSPEQAEGKPVDSRTDLWSLGVILYESLAGRAPFQGDSGLAILRAISHDAPDPLHRVRADVPNEADRIVSRALEKNVSSRYQSASEMARDLSAAVLSLSTPAALAATAQRGIPRRYASLSAVLLLAFAAIGAWSIYRYKKSEWAREEAVPRIRQLLNDDQPVAAFLILKEAQKFLPGDRQIEQIAAENIHPISIGSSPSGATVEVQDYVTPERPWLRLGVTPLANIPMPSGYFRWKVSRQNNEIVSARMAAKQMMFDLNAQQGVPPRMSRVGAGTWRNMIDFLGWLGPYRLPPFDIDRYEVTNREYQEFIDRGGYAKREYWKSKFILNGRELSWDEAMSLLRDRTGRAGPSTWQGGHFPAGQDDYPVSGVSWYEASAYAAYAGKSLPVLSQWFTAAPPDLAPWTVHQSNISNAALAAVGTFKGLGPYGTYDMVGNVREWVENATGENEHFLLGGAWNSQSYLSVDPEALPAFDRSPTNGFRCVRNLAALPADAAGRLESMHRDFSTYKPASDEVFRAYQSMYAYDKTPLKAKVDGVVQDSADWQEQKISFDAAYGNERMTAYLFLPKKVRPPYETVVFFPSARVLFLHDSKSLGDIPFFDYIVQSGRAVFYPVYKGTYERQERFVLPGTRHEVDLTIQRFKDVARALDYLRTRSDIDTHRLGYLGVSMGAAEGVIYSTLLQEQLKTVVLLDGGYFLFHPPPGTDQADFAPRLKTPVLMVNGRYDFTFPLERSQEPLFRMLGTPAADKQHVVLDSPHDVTARRGELVHAVLGWLDKYLGPIR